MKAAVVSSYGTVPHFGDIAAAVPAGADIVVDVLAAALHPRVRSQAAGSHYTSTDRLPLVPGVDGVGRGPDGELRYFVLFDTPHGSMAEQAVVDPRRCVALPGGSDPVAVAAAMNPAMSSWIGLRRRIDWQPGSNVLILGATGAAGRLAVQVAKHLGAGQIVAAGRDPRKLAALSRLGATGTVELDGTSAAADQLAAAGADADVVLDYLWGEPTAQAMRAIVPNRADDDRSLTWLQIGSVAGATAAIPSAALRATRLSIVGSGQGSVPTADIAAELPELVAAVTGGVLEVNARAVPLAEVERAWGIPADERIVFVP